MTTNEPLSALTQEERTAINNTGGTWQTYFQRYELTLRAAEKERDDWNNHWMLVVIKLNAAETRADAAVAVLREMRGAANELMQRPDETDPLACWCGSMIYIGDSLKLEHSLSCLQMLHAYDALAAVLAAEEGK